MTGHARYVGRLPASATELSASLYHVMGVQDVSYGQFKRH